jgi:hypothetical protein
VQDSEIDKLEFIPVEGKSGTNNSTAGQSRRITFVGDAIRNLISNKFSEIIQKKVAELKNTDGLTKKEFYLLQHYYNTMKEE